MGDRMNRWPLVLLLIYGFWAVAAFTLISSQEGAVSNWDAATLGQFGDAFGGLNALMVSLAATFTWQTLRDERQRNEKLQKRDLEQQAELTFFRMLEMRRAVLDDVTYDGVRGIGAFKEMRARLIVLSPGDELRLAYEDCELSAGGTLEHYFRITYHTVRLLDASFAKADAYEYIRILRSQISGPEQFLIAVNAVHGRGKPKMLDHINNFSFLHALDTPGKKFLRSIPGEDLKEAAFTSPTGFSDDQV